MAYTTQQLIDMSLTVYDLRTAMQKFYAEYQGLDTSSSSGGDTDITSTDELAEGEKNLYFTAQRVRNTAMQGIVFTDATTVTASDTVLTSIGKLQAQASSYGNVVSYNIGTSGAAIPLLSTENTWSMPQTFDGGLAGSLTGSLIGNASTATKLQTARNINLNGSVKGGVQFDGSQDVLIATEFAEFDSEYATSIGGYPEGAILNLTGGNSVVSTIANNLADPNSDMTGWEIWQKDSGALTWSGRTQEEKNREIITIKDYGAACDGTTVDDTAIAAMYADKGFIRFPMGITKLTTQTLLGDLYFDYGASITLDVSNTLTISANIHADPKQTIFSGLGSYNLVHVSASGQSYEGVRHVYAAWYGVYPSNDLTINQAPMLQKISDSLGNAREGIVEFMMGNYQLKTAVLWNRGIEVRGAGTRRTVFKMTTDGFIPFQTNNTAVRFRGFQFEYDLSTITSRTSPLLQINHSDCEIHDVGIYPSAAAIVINGLNTLVRDIRVTWGTDMTSITDSSAIKIQKGGCVIDNVRALTSNFAPQNLILVNPVGGNLSYVNISNVHSILPCTSVTLKGSANNITNININSIQYNNPISGASDSVIKLLTSGVGIIRGVNIDNIVCNGTPTQTILINADTANIQNVNIDNVTDARLTGYPVYLQRTSGTISELEIGKVAAVSITNVVGFLSHTSINYKLSNLSEKNITNPKTWDISLGDDDVYTIDLPPNMFVAGVDVVCGASGTLHYAQLAARFASTSVVQTITASTNVVAVANTTLAGTTGTDGKVTIAINTNQLQIENRTGATSFRASVTIKCGIMT